MEDKKKYALILLINLALFIMSEDLKAAKLTINILNNYKWYSNYGLNYSNDSIIVFISNKSEFYASKMACPFFEWAFYDKPRIELTKYLYCKEPPTHVTRFFDLANYTIETLFGKQYLVLCIDEKINVYKIVLFTHKNRSYIIQMVASKHYEWK